MRTERLILALDPYEHGIVVTALNDMRNGKLKERRPTDVVDDVLLKAIEAPIRKVRVPERDEAR